MDMRKAVIPHFNDIKSEKKKISRFKLMIKAGFLLKNHFSHLSEFHLVLFWSHFQKKI